MNMKKTTFLLLMLSIVFSAVAQSNYAVMPIPFAQYQTTSPNMATMDDRCSGLIPLPFNFDFYGVSYNQIVISTNGYIDFRSSSANMSSPFSFSQTIPNAGFPVKNAILGAYADLNNANGEGTITYGQYGTAPFRKFVVYFNNNSFFSCTAFKSTFQMILSETSNTIDIQLIDKQTCSSGSGRTVSGIINLSGDQGLSAPGRNTGFWTAFHEGWRYYRPNYYSNYSYVRCDDDTDGFQVFDLTIAATDLFGDAAIPVGYYEDADLTISISNPAAYTNISNAQTIYLSGGGAIKPVVLQVVDCATDFDNDTVASSDEDLNADGNLANDDTDFDGLPNYLDNDDDGDLVLTNVEYVFGRNTTSLLDSDNDTIPNYLDNDDDGDNLLTFMEDYDGNGNPVDDDTNGNLIPDFLENAVALGTSTLIDQKELVLFPNPADTVLHIDNKSDLPITGVSVYNLNGMLVKEVQSVNTIDKLSVSELQSGVYFIRLQDEQGVYHRKFVKK